MVKSYTRYEPLNNFGVVCSSTCNIITRRSEGSKSIGRCFVGALESVLEWDLKTGELLSKWRDSDCSASATAISSFGELFAVGYSDGSIRLWQKGSLQVTLNGHKNAVTALQFNNDGTKLASGSKDTDIILWDVVGETGLYRLRGHKDQITEVRFLASPISDETDTSSTSEQEYLLSAGKDSFLKLWDLSAQHCIETHVEHHGEIWALAVTPDEKRCLTAGTDSDIKVWSISLPSDGVLRPDVKAISFLGSIPRLSKERPISVQFNDNGKFVAIQSHDRVLEVLQLRTEEELQKILNRRRRRKKSEDVSLALKDEFAQFAIIRAPARISSVSWTVDGKNPALVCSLGNNSIDVYTLNTKASADVPVTERHTKTHAIELPGHRADVRTLSLSINHDVLLSGANGSLKIWNVKTGTCLLYCRCFKNGDIEIYDVAGSSLVETIKAHDGAIYDLSVSQDGSSFATASADKTVKLWSIKASTDLVPGTTRKIDSIKIKQTRQIDFNDDVLSVKLSPDGRLIAASLLDNTVKVYYLDTLKLFLNLYGHKLPVLSMDIAYDSKLLVTCSADKNVKLWGLDFGDCHKSIFAHQDSIMDVAFQPNSHNFFTCSKDHEVRYWDGDSFDLILKLRGHHSEVWCIAVAPTFVVSGSHDHSIRVWAESDDLVFLEEEKERELEEQYESTLVNSYERDEQIADTDEAQQDSVAAVTKQTVESLKDGEKLMEALEIGIADLDLEIQYLLEKRTRPNMAHPPRNPILAHLKLSAEEYVLSVLKKIRTSHLEDALLVLPFDRVLGLFRFVDIWARREWAIPLCCRVLFFLIRTYNKQLSSNEVMVPLLNNIRTSLRKSLSKERSMIGYNYAGLSYLKREWEMNHNSSLEDVDRTLMENDGKKRAFSNIV
ncbi:U3 snoRNA associted protein Dip2 [Schizosaccharomyces japonicus yFS275]|uniref:U3 snoRNA associted protein Dip2 n=1 Tax=Schizosaccharomyces japonicus (strain yFS275 / FY16936) TaxID=402676 RepID=B6K236_SCHJY|nr:U3 snoRNA associted protein Dip2 [Schizosaccharomyces japonicus yFS275]EEB07217.2 U3 snoRNA associted protein Dip2 [Schizosaccharomyces japonicus yFS275]